jgi:hypothetical protein
MNLANKKDCKMQDLAVSKYGSTKANRPCRSDLRKRDARMPFEHDSSKGTDRSKRISQARLVL